MINREEGAHRISRFKGQQEALKSISKMCENQIVASDKAIKIIEKKIKTVVPVEDKKEDGWERPKRLDKECYITKTGRFRHINVPVGELVCPVCNEKKEKLVSHHVIAKRITQKKGYLGELRIKICAECEEKNHPENVILKLMPLIESLTSHVIDKLPAWKRLKKIILNGE